MLSYRIVSLSDENSPHHMISSRKHFNLSTLRTDAPLHLTMTPELLCVYCSVPGVVHAMVMVSCTSRVVLLVNSDFSPGRSSSTDRICYLISPPQQPANHWKAQHVWTGMAFTLNPRPKSERGNVSRGVEDWKRGCMEVCKRNEAHDSREKACKC